MRLRLFACLLASVICTAGYGANFYPISSVTSSTMATDLFPVSNLIQGPGIGIQAVEPHDKTLGGEAGNWVTAACGFPCDYIATTGTPVLTFDLGQNVPLSEISIWGYANSNANGLEAFKLRFATAAEGTGGFGTSIAYNPTLGGLTNNETVRQSRPFAQSVTARYVELTATDNFFVAPGDGSGGTIPGGDRVGIGEVAFQVPEPTTACLVLMGLLGMLRFRRRK